MEEAASNHYQWRRALGPAAFLTFAVTGLTGLGLVGPYDPFDAHASVERMGGATSWLRSVHSWMASATLILGVLAMTDAWQRKAAWTGSFRNWFAASIGFAVVAGAILVGGLLPADQHAAESREHVAAVARLFAIDEGSLSEWNYFVLHVWAIPAAAAGVVWVFVSRYRWYVVPSIVSAWPLAAGTTMAAVVLAFSLPPTFGPRPIDGLSVGKPDWSFLWLVPLQDWLGAQAGLFVGLTGLAMLVGLAPWAGRTLSRRHRALVAAAMVGTLLFLSVLGMRF